jgi:hypothetical protein
LAGCGQGNDAAKLNDQERAGLRKQARDWLTAELAIWTKKADGDAAAREQVQKTLQQWQRDPDLAGLRAAAALARLPEAERKAFRQLWTKVDEVLKRTQSK